GSLTIFNSTISGNVTGAGGNGGVAGYGGKKKDGTFRTSGRAGTGGGGGRGGGLLSVLVAGAPVHLTNVTIYGNLTGDGGTGGGGGGGAESTLGGGIGGWGGDGGGIWAHGAKSGSEMTLMHVTIAGNGLGAGGLGGGSPDPISVGSPGGRGVGAGIDTGGRYDPAGAGVYEKNSIVANNGSNLAGDANCFQRYLPTYTDIVDQGGNVTWNDTTCPGKVADPLLGALADNGGPTETVLPGAGGSAIGAVAAASCLVHEDQRGLPRPGASGKVKCDAGAVETQVGDEEPEEEEPPGEEEEPPGEEEEKGGGGEQPGTGGGNNAAGSSADSTAPPASAPAPQPTPKPLKCKKGFKKKTVKGKPRCVKVKKTHPHHKA
ncbi:MAG TPA: choice-of-anchor Q domain-containing protein, partial [Solirubrobacterales bacterium]|nr:choice-of-anchor Q domain-containing protein [Solirubrobacterales bacterium]